MQKSITAPSLVNAAYLYCARRAAPQSAVDCGLNSSDVLANETTYPLQCNKFIML